MLEKFRHVELYQLGYLKVFQVEFWNARKEDWSHALVD
jgi:hypothetical protein